jgi:hypothetical protein
MIRLKIKNPLPELKINIDRNQKRKEAGAKILIFIF